MRFTSFVVLFLLAPTTARGQAPIQVSVSPLQIGAGSGDTRIKISGYSFTPSTQVLWNGQSRATQFINDFLLKTTITQSDLAKPGLNQLSIIDNSSGQIFSGPTPMLVYLPLANNDLTYDSSRDRIYVSVSKQDPNGPSLAIVNPEQGVVERYLPLPAEPGALALTGDSNNLYIGMSDRIRRMDLTGSTAAVDIPASAYHGVPPPGPGQTPTYLPVSLLPLPNQPTSFVVTVNAAGAYTTSVIDGTTLRDVKSTFGRCLAGSSPDGMTIYSGPGLVITELMERSIFVLPYENDSLDSGPTCPVYYNGLMYGSDGDVVDVASRSRVRWIAALGNVDVVAQYNEVHFLDQNGASLGSPHLVFKAFDLSSGSLLKSIPLGIPTSTANGGGVNGHLIHWGSNGVAFGDYSTVNSRVAKWLYIIQVP